MKVDARVYRILKWTSRISATAVLMFGLPFYFGYGNPLPFTNPQYSLYDNSNSRPDYIYDIDNSFK
jgi:hypothetical protein